MKNCKNQNAFANFIFKIYNYYIVSFNDFLKITVNKTNKINNILIYYILLRGIYIIKHIFIYNIYLLNTDISNLQNILKKMIDLYFKFIDQMININNTVNLNIKDAEIFIYKKFIDKSINDFTILDINEKKYIEIINLHNKYLQNNILLYKDTSFDSFNSEYVLNYYKKYIEYIKNI